MKKRSIRFLAVVLVIGLMAMLSCSAAAVSEGTTVEPRYVSISFLSADLSIATSGFASSTCKVRLSNLSNIVVVTMELQREETSGWRTIASWSESANYVAMNKGYYVLPNYNYRVLVSVTVYDNNGGVVETQSKASLTQVF